MSRKLIESALTRLKGITASTVTRGLRPVELQEVQRHVERLFDHTVPGGKYQRSRLAVNVYQALVPVSQPGELENAVIVASTIEMLQAYFLIQDDIMDYSETRRSRPCWYKVPDIGLNAVNDATLIGCGIEEIVRTVIPGHVHRETILNLLSQIKLRTSVGQHLDAMSSSVDTCNWSRYDQIVEFKTSYYTFYVPLMMGFLLADVLGHTAACRAISLKLGYFFQAQDDYLDVFGDPRVTGKSGSDIANGKCTWITCRVVEKLASDPTKAALFRSNFASQDPEKIAVAKSIIDEAGVARDFAAFQDKITGNLHAQIDAFPRIEVRDVLHDVVDVLAKRES